MLGVGVTYSNVSVHSQQDPKPADSGQQSFGGKKEKSDVAPQSQCVSYSIISPVQVMVHRKRCTRFRDPRNFAVGTPGVTDMMNAAVHSVGELS